MPAIEQLLTLGLAHGSDPARALLGPAGLGTRSTDRLQWTDVMQAVVRIPRAQRAALFLRAAPQLVDALELAELTNTLAIALIEHDRKAGTYTPEQHRDGSAWTRQARIVRVAIDEYIDPRVCRVCKGNGATLVHVEGKGVQAQSCEKCQGCGMRPWSATRRIARVEVCRDHWKPRYAAGYERTVAGCHQLYRAGSDNLRTALFGEWHEQVKVETRQVANA